MMMRDEIRTIQPGDRIHEVNRPDEVCIVERVRGPHVFVSVTFPDPFSDVGTLTEWDAYKVYEIEWTGERWIFPKITLRSYIEDVLGGAVRQ